MFLRRICFAWRTCYEKNIPVNIEDEMKKSYMDYAMSVIIGRAIPDVRDGLKPVHRRVLFAMSEMGNRWNKPYKKSASIVGDIIGKYHPHGDTAAYDTIVRMAQDFSMRYPLDRRPGELRLHRRRSAGRHAVHRDPDGQHRRRAPGGPGEEHRRLHAQLRRIHGGADRPARAKIPMLLLNGTGGHRRRRGDQHPAPQPAAR